MKLSIIGIENVIEIIEGDISFLNIHNNKLYRQVIRFCINELNDKAKNLIVITNDDERFLQKDICFVNNLFDYNFDNKSLIDKLVKPYIMELNTYVSNKENETKMYYNLIKPLIDYVNTLEVDYGYKEELDPNFYLKLIGIDFSINNDSNELEKVISIIKLEMKILRKRLFIFNGLLRILTSSELEELEDFVNENSVFLLLIDNIDESVVVNMNYLYIDDDFGSYYRTKKSI